MLTSTFAFSTSYAQFAGQGTPASNAAISNGTTSNNTNIGIVSREHFDAGKIYRTNNMTVIDPSIRNLVIIIPDNIGANRSSTPSWPTFMPASATIAEGMRVIWFNADVNATHNITVRIPQEESSIPPALRIRMVQCTDLVRLATTPIPILHFLARTEQ
jgi:hypothetical protein